MGPGSVTDKASRRLWPLAAEALLARARRRTGRSDFGEPPVEPALTVLTRSLDQEADLHPLGRLLIRKRLEELLATRLRLVDAWKRQERQLLATRIERPLFITGLPRSGSTFLHELLAADPGNRAPRVWELMFPLAARADIHRPHNPLIRRTAARLWWIRRLAPDADAVHPLRACSPQECETIHSYTFQSEEFLSTCWVPGYEAWLRAADFAPVYAWQRKFLQYLQGPGPAPRWVLKSPDHVNSLGALLAVFPDAVIVQTHREPLDVLASSLRLIEVVHGLFARPGGRETRARREARVLAEAVERLLLFRETHPELTNRFIDVRYPELVNGPLATIGRIYEHWGAPLTGPAAEAMCLLVSRRSRYPGTRLITNPGPEEVLAAEIHRFSRYAARFGFPARPGEASPPLRSES
ncbi:MAG: sulfotransferase [Desulfobacteraceae bacterium]|nr:sulfotransferase [Desulfobacteraceae bacterium]